MHACEPVQTGTPDGTGPLIQNMFMSKQEKCTKKARNCRKEKTDGAVQRGTSEHGFV